MSRRRLVALSLIGLAGAGAESIVFALTIEAVEYTSWWEPVAGLAGGVGAGVLAGIIVMSSGPARRIFVVIVAVLSGLAAFGGLSTATWILENDFNLGPQLEAYSSNGPAFDWQSLVASLVTATFVLAAGLICRYTRANDDVLVRTRLGFLAVAIIPFFNVLGFAGLTVYAIARRAPAATPARPAVSA